MRSIVSIVAIALLTASWVTCVGAAGAPLMACCAKVQHDCPKMEQLSMCCPARQQANPDAATARLEPIARLIVTVDAGFLAHPAAAPVVPTLVELRRSFIETSPPTRHSIDCILLI